MGNELVLMVPRNIWADEWAFSRWLKRKGITEFFWEVSRYPDYVMVEVIT